MKLIIFFLIHSIASFARSRDFYLYKDASSLAVYGDNTCLIKDGEVKCFGEPSYGITDVPNEIKRAKYVALTLRMACAIDDKLVKCWGNGFKDQIIPQVSNPRKLFMRDSNVCVVGDEGVRCAHYLDSNLPEAQNAVNVAMAAAGVMLIQKDGSMFPVFNKPVMLPGYESLRVKEVFSGYFGPYFYLENGQLLFDSLALHLLRYAYYDEGDTSNLQSFSSGFRNECRINRGLVSCEKLSDGEFYGSLYIHPSQDKFFNPKVISVGKSHACVLDDEGAKCWGDDTHGQVTFREAK
jgi:hypothetical protein